MEANEPLTLEVTGNDTDGSLLWKVSVNIPGPDYEKQFKDVRTALKTLNRYFVDKEFEGEK